MNIFILDNNKNRRRVYFRAFQRFYELTNHIYESSFFKFKVWLSLEYAPFSLATIKAYFDEEMEFYRRDDIEYFQR